MSTVKPSRKTLVALAVLAVSGNFSLFAHHIPDEILIRWNTPPQADTWEIRAASLTITKLRDIEGSPWQLWKMPHGRPCEEALGPLSVDPAVAVAQPNYLRASYGTVPNDPLITSQKHLDNIRAYAGWDFETGASTAITIAVIDTGVDITHPDLIDNIWSSPTDTTVDGTDQDGSGFDGDKNGRNFASDNNDVSDVAGHGTLVAGVAAARGNNATGVSGVVWRAKILPIQIFKLTGCGAAPPPCADDATLVTAINYAVRVTTVSSLRSYTGRTVINMSLGGSTTSQILLDAINQALANGIMVVAAKGNDGNSSPIYPSDYPGVLGVGAVTNTDTLAYFSNFGAGTDLVAPGVDIFGTKNGGGYFSNSGTSFSSPQVAGAVALIYSALPSATTSQVESVLLSSLDDLGAPGRDDYFGYGRLNLFKIMRRARYGTLVDFDALAHAIAMPNPYKVATGQTVTFSVPNSIVGANPKVEIYDVSGSLIRQLTGTSWDGRNENGASVASGVYVFRVKTDNGKSQGRVIVEASGS